MSLRRWDPAALDAGFVRGSHTEALLAHARTFGRVAYADEVLAELVQGMRR